MIDEALAKRRFAVLNVMRLGGLALVMFGLAITQGVIDLPRELGMAIVVIGMVDFFVLPRLLSKRWRSEEK
ncbi:MAG: hypothetical protein A3J40_05745 [Erythrobacter sp. RIFCSPHIGHO2_12_FULL_63_10]|nr:MAG: hypothetical protein A3J40_05745 [Erythrobacter sp. RIFCSPHIGHO2_12_FULL_63_10]